MDEFLDSFGSIESYLKFALLAATYRLWGPVLKTIVREIKLATDVPRGSLLDKLPPTPPARAPGDDPWIAVPLAAHRSRTASHGRAAGRVRRVGKAERGGSRPAGGSTRSRPF